MSSAVPQPVETLVRPHARWPWWLAVPLAPSLLSWQETLRRGAWPTARAAAGAVVPAAAAVAFFAWLGGSAGRGAGSGAATILLLFQFSVLMAQVPGRRGHEIFVEPDGPLVPYAPAHLAVLWLARLLAPVAALFGLAYAGLVLGSPGLSAADGALAWISDSAALASGVLAYALVRWTFGTHVPMGIRTAVTFLWNGLARNLGALVLSAFFLVAAQYAATGVFVSRGVQAAIGETAAALASRSPAPDAAAAVESVRSLTRVRPLSVMSSLLRDAESATSWTEAWVRIGILAGVAVLLLAPARRREEPVPTVPATRLGEGLHDLVAGAMPMRWRLPARLSLPYIGESVAFVFPAGAVLFAAALAFALRDADLAAGRTARPLPETALTGLGYTLGALSALTLAPVLRRLGLAGTRYAELCALPVEIPSLVRRMGVFCLSLIALEQLAVALVWARLWTRSWSAAALFGACVMLLVITGSAVAVGLQTAVWRLPASARERVRAAWTFAFGCVMVLPYHFVRSTTAVFGPLLVLELVVAVAAVLWMWHGLAAMAREREPWGQE